jgi:hypothetical protein
VPFLQAASAAAGGGMVCDKNWVPPERSLPFHRSQAAPAPVVPPRTRGHARVPLGALGRAGTPARALEGGTGAGRASGRTRRRHRQEISSIFLLAWRYTEALEPELDRAGRSFVYTSDCFDALSRLMTSADFLLFLPRPRHECLRVPLTNLRNDGVTFFFSPARDQTRPLSASGGRRLAGLNCMSQ